LFEESYKRREIYSCCLGVELFTICKGEKISLSIVIQKKERKEETSTQSRKKKRTEVMRKRVV
jgi:hypothetical protein